MKCLIDQNVSLVTLSFADRVREVPGRLGERSVQSMFPKGLVHSVVIGIHVKELNAECEVKLESAQPVPCDIVVCVATDICDRIKNQGIARPSFYESWKVDLSSGQTVFGHIKKLASQREEAVDGDGAGLGAEEASHGEEAAAADGAGDGSQG